MRFQYKNKGKESMEMTDLLYVDDTIVFCEAYQEQLYAI